MVNNLSNNGYYPRVEWLSFLLFLTVIGCDGSLEQEGKRDISFSTKIAAVRVGMSYEETVSILGNTISTNYIFSYCDPDTKISYYICFGPTNELSPNKEPFDQFHVVAVLCGESLESSKYVLPADLAGVAFTGVPDLP